MIAGLIFSDRQATSLDVRKWRLVCCMTRLYRHCRQAMRGNRTTHHEKRHEAKHPDRAHHICARTNCKTKNLSQLRSALIEMATAGDIQAIREVLLRVLADLRKRT